MPTKRLLSLAGPILLLALSAAWLQLHWNSIPERFPIHWGLSGEVNGWASRTPLGVFQLHLIGLLVVGAMAFTSATQAVRPHAMAASAWILSALFAGIGLLPLYAGPDFPVRWVLIPVAIAVIAVTALLLLSRPPEAAEPSEHWKAGVFYFNPGDPSLWVPKRFGIGYTVNFAHKSAWLTAAILLLAPLLLMAIMSKRG